MKTIYLYPGQWTCVTEPSMISTLLGSCVAVALFDRVSGVAGLNHYLLPQPMEGEASSTRYGSTAIQALYEAMLQNGAQPRCIQAKVYGGANVLNQTAAELMVGDRNIEFALAKLEELRIPVVEKNVGGQVGRKIYFSTETFEVVHKLMRESG